MNKNIPNPLAVLIILLVIAVIVAISLWLCPKEEMVSPQDETADWKTYRNEERGFEIKYPENLITISQEDKEIIMSHSILFEHADPCDFKGDAPSLKKLTDFEVTLEVVKKDLRETVIMLGGDFIMSNFLVGDKLKIEPGFIDEITIGSLKGYRITSGVEGCGDYTYYLQANLNNTLFVKRSFVTEFNPIIANYKEYLSLPGVISPDKEEKLFNQIFSTFRFIETESQGTVTLTQVIQYVPAEIPSEIKEGYCWVNSISVPRKGAWRCMIESSISDPCFVIEGGEDLVCDPNPITGNKGFLLKLTQPLPEDTAKDNFGQGWGWLIELEDGTTCGFLTGATGVINNERINYGCSDKSYIVGDLGIGTIWKAEKVDNKKSTSTEVVSIKRVWQ